MASWTRGWFESRNSAWLWNEKTYGEERKGSSMSGSEWEGTTLDRAWKFGCVDTPIVTVTTLAPGMYGYSECEGNHA
jgi:hypothetical protein